MLDIIPTALVPEGARLYPVGRLDQDSEGLLVLTNDGAWAERVLHPRHGVEREYAIGLRAPADAGPGAALKAGIELEEGLATLDRAAPDDRDRDTPARRAHRPAAGRPRLVPGDPGAGLEAPVAPDVRGGRAPRSSGSSGSGSGRSGSTTSRAAGRAGCGRRRFAASGPGQGPAEPVRSPAPARGGTTNSHRGRAHGRDDRHVPGMSEPLRIAEGTLLWEPSAAFREASTMADYLHWLERERGLRFADYAALWRWSVDDLEAFWSSIVDYYDIPLRGDRTRVLADATMPGARWFEGAELNYAEALFGRARARPTGAPLRVRARARSARSAGLSCATSVAAAAAGLRRLGVGRGDRVAAVIPNIPEAVIALVACASIGAIWSSCSPDFGTHSLVDRFAQIEPKVLIAVDGYTYGGKPFDRAAVIEELRAALPHARADGADPVPRPGCAPAPTTRRDDLGRRCSPGRRSRCAFEPVPFDHPLWVLVSRRARPGCPKAIVHGHGGVVLEHAKAVGLHVRRPRRATGCRGTRRPAG